MGRDKMKNTYLIQQAIQDFNNNTEFNAQGAEVVHDGRQNTVLAVTAEEGE